ncbi:MAG: hypothetical protein KatS3mg110_2572 [Pirellulaceae bacterium]|nr:MAG: hypothetical protein KatS3mg110_2572 [Pirellulaceae bacterium]
MLPQGLGILALILGLWLAIWITVLRIISWLGWNRLAASFRAPGSFALPRLHLGFQSVSIGGIGYNGCVWIGVDEKGLLLQCRPSWLFPFHPPVLLPWGCFEKIHTWQLGPWRFLVVTVYLPDEQRIALRLPSEVLRLAQQLRDCTAPNGAGDPERIASQ